MLNAYTRHKFEFEIQIPACPLDEELSNFALLVILLEGNFPGPLPNAAGIFCRLQVAGCRLKQLVYLSQSRINPSIEANRKQPTL